MPLKPEDRAAYQRDYRAKQAGKIVPVAPGDIDAALGIKPGSADEVNLIFAKHINQVAGLEHQIAELKDEVKRLKAELATRPLPGTNPVNDIPESVDLARRHAETFRAHLADPHGPHASGTDATRVAGSHASGPWTPEFRPAPKSVAEPKPKRRR